MKRSKLFAPVIVMALIQTGSVAQRRSTATDLTGIVVSKMEEVAASLDTVRCLEEVRRYEDKGDRVRPLDRIVMNVDRTGDQDSYEQVWRFSLDGTREKPYRHPSELHGAWHSGEFSAVLRTTAAALGSTTPIVAPGRFSGETSIYFMCGGPCWSLRVRSGVYPTGVEMGVLVDSETAELHEISWRSNSLDRGLGIARIELTVTYGKISIAGVTRTVPVNSTYRVIYSTPDNRVARNVTEFSGYRRFGSESALTFEPVADN